MTRSTAWERVRQARRLAELPAAPEARRQGGASTPDLPTLDREAALSIT